MIGGGVGGISTIVGLCKLDKRVEIVLVEPKSTWRFVEQPIAARLKHGLPKVLFWI